jgi:hypothetical protein
MPTVTIGGNTADDFSGSEDAQMKEALSTNNYGGTTSFQTSLWAVGDYTHALISFSGISNLPSSLTVSSVTMYLYLTGSDSGTTATITTKRLLRDWEEGTQNGADRQNDTPDSCCWDEYGSGNSWTTAGGTSDGNDRSSTNSGDWSVNDTTGEYKSLSTAQLAADVEDFADGTLSNYGWHEEVTAGLSNSDYREFASTEGTDGQRPYLSVTYTSSDTVSVTDSGSGVDTIQIDKEVFTADSGAGVDTIQIDKELFLVDSGVGVDSLQLENEIFTTDSGSGVDVLQLDKELFVTDIGTGVDSLTLLIDALITDSGTGVDVVDVVEAVEDINITDSGIGVDSLSIIADIFLNDLGIGVDNVTLFLEKIVADSGAGVDVVDVITEIIKYELYFRSVNAESEIEFDEKISYSEIKFDEKII